MFSEMHYNKMGVGHFANFLKACGVLKMWLFAKFENY